MVDLYRFNWDTSLYDNFDDFSSKWEKEGYVTDTKTSAREIAADEKHATNRAIYFWASKLGRPSIFKFFETIRPDTKVLELRSTQKQGFWVAVFETHDIAAEIIINGHGRLPYPKTNFPYLSNWLWKEGDEHTHDMVSIHMTWREKKVWERPQDQTQLVKQ
jgi:hypothetical protein